MRSFRSVSMGVLAICFATAAESAIVTSARSAVVEIIAYTQYGNGDVTFRLASNSLVACRGGFWIRATDPGAKTTLSMIVAAYQANIQIVVDADDAQIWTGSSEPNCLVWDIRL